MRPDRRRELPDELGVPAVGELALEPSFQRGQTQLLEARDLALREVLEREVGERRAAPQCQRLLVAVLREQLAEAVQVELVRRDTQHVAGRPRLEPAGRRAAAAASTRSRAARSPRSAGGDSPHSASTSRSWATTSFARSSR